MNSKTLNHLNKLFSLARPVVLSKNFTISGSANDQGEALWPRLQECAKKYNAEMIRQEIIRAAKEKVIGDTCNPTYSYHDARSLSSIPWNGTLRQWILARKEIDAIIEADNQRRVDEYEVYRLACEQGVAVPPAE